MNILTLSHAFPNSEQPNYGVFVANRVRQLASSGEAIFRVLAPVAWRSSDLGYRGRGGEETRIAQSEELGPCTIDHPRYCVIPKLGYPIAPILMYLSAARHIARLQQDGYRFDLIDAHFFYPDGVAAVLLGRRFSKPVVITGRGSDLNHHAHLPVIGQMIRWALAQTDWTITVSSALKEQAIALGAAKERVTVLRNGVDLELFRPTLREKTRRRLGLTQTTLLSVGDLVELKGHDLVIRAMKELPNTQLFIIGEGPQKTKLRALADRLDLSDRVHLLGSVPHRELPAYYSAMDIFILASSREGWPNVLLEAMACGTPAIATRVGGVPEVMAAKNAGIIVDARSPEAIAAAVQQLRIATPGREQVRAHAKQFGWDEVVDLQLDLYKNVIQTSVVSLK